MPENPYQTSTPRLRQDLFERLAERKAAVFWTGVGLIVAGVLALIFPVFTTLTVEAFIGLVLVIAGAATIFGAFSVQGMGPFFGHMLLGLLTLGLGIYLLGHPVVGLLTLTLLIAAVFMIDAAVQFAFAFDLKPRDGWGWVMLSAITSAAVGFLIAAGFPGTSLVALGLLVGVKFVVTGIGFVMLSRVLTPQAVA